MRSLSISVTILVFFGLLGCSGDNPVRTGNGGGYPEAVGWQIQNPYPTQNTLFSVYFVDEGTGWAVGDGGTILKTLNGGETWVHQESNFEGSLWKVIFLDDKHGWIISLRDGVALKTIDGGENWISKQVREPGILRDIFFFNKDIGWIVGHDTTILHTTDGGESWMEQTAEVNQYKDAFQSVYFIDSLRGWIAGGGGDAAVLYTENAGTTWTDIGQTDAAGYNQLYFADESTGWGYLLPGWVLKTEDGGVNWQRKHRAQQWLHGFLFLDSLTGWVVGENGFVEHTTDGGITWAQQETSLLGYLMDIFFTDRNVGWITGENGIILKTMNGGQDWVSKSRVTIEDLYETDFVDHRTGWAVGKNGTIVSTIDGGQTWELQDCPNEWYWGVDFVSHQTGYAVGTNGRVIKTQNGGITWEAQQSNTLARLHAVHAVDESNVWAVGTSGRITHTSDGVNWEEQETGVTDWLFTVYFVDENIGWAAGTKLLHTKDGGVTWQVLEQPYSIAIYDICFLNDTVGFWVGSQVGVYKTHDGGKTWDFINLFEFGYINYLSIQFIDENRGYMVGEEYLDRWGKILYTADGGETWDELNDGHGHGIYSVKFIDKDVGWAVGAAGIILHTTTGGRE